LPGGDHDLDRKRNRLNAPRVLWDVEGHFVVQVRIRGEFNPTRKSSTPGVPPSVTAGVLLTFPDGTFVRLDFGAARGVRGRQGCVYMRYLDRLGGGMFTTVFDRDWKQWPLPDKAEHAYLKLEWDGKLFRAFLGPDGEKWTQIGGPFGCRVPPKLKVGLAAYSTSTEPFKVRFDQFKLTRIGPGAHAPVGGRNVSAGP
jgi:hypothetical protein